MLSSWCSGFSFNFLNVEIIRWRMKCFWLWATSCEFEASLKPIFFFFCNGCLTICSNFHTLFSIFNYNHHLPPPLSLQKKRQYSIACGCYRWYLSGWRGSTLKAIFKTVKKKKSHWSGMLSGNYTHPQLWYLMRISGQWTEARRSEVSRLDPRQI